jgi:phytoene dehydrogenase-like protein
LLHPKVIADLNLHQHGLRIIPRKVNNLLPLPDGDSFVSISGKLAEEVARFSKQDVDALQDYEALLSAVVPVAKDIMLMQPPALDDAGISDLLGMFKLSRQFSNLNRREKQFLFTLLSRSAGEILDDFFTTPALKALLGFDAIVGNYVSPYTPGNGYNLLHHLLGEVNGESGRWGHAIGGMGSVSDAMVKEGTKYSVRYHTNAAVEKVIVENGSVKGVITENSKVYEADTVVANVNPMLLFNHMLAETELPSDLASHFQQYKCGSGAFRLNVALNGLPDYPGRQVPDCLESGIILGPSLEYMDRAFLDANRNGWSSNPVIEMLIPSLVDDSLAPEGHHVASLFCQHFSPELGEKWDVCKEQAVASILETVEVSFPGFKSLIEGIQVLSPWDLEQQFGLIGGDIFHGRLSLEQLFTARPAIGLAQYEMPFKGLFLCGAGAHPGGGVSGLPGHNAARRILA